MYYTRRCTGTGACVLPSHAACTSTHLLWQLPHSRMFRGAAQDDCATTSVFCNLFICQFRGANAYFFQGEIIPHPRVDVDKHLFKFEPRHTSAVITGRFDGGAFWRVASTELDVDPIRETWDSLSPNLESSVESMPMHCPETLLSPLCSSKLQARSEYTLAAGSGSCT